MEKILSIIIPTYNMEEYIGNCLTSLLIRDLFDKLEIIVINDGSKDESLNIALQYQKQYPKSIKVINKSNGNYGSCVNRGLKESTGKYIKILDSDDSFNTDILQNLIRTLKDINVDAVFTDYVIVNRENKIQYHSTYNFPKQTPFDFKKYCNNDTMLKINMHSITYKRENLLALNYQQTEGISYTDQEWIFLPIIKVKTAFYYEYPLYRYLVGRNGQTMDENILIKNINQLVIVALSMIKIYTRQKLEETSFYKKYFLCKIRQQLNVIYCTYLIKNYHKVNELIKFDNEIKEISEEVYQNSNYILLNKYFKYIAYWRKNKNTTKLPFIIKFNYKINRLYHSIKNLVN